ncbi:hypothetical protein [Nannocystis pusilla]|uniref:hypothetical protein n=1 Tax=Nannocystis pusilla TaxID=889268 RepID=UPI003DA42705
MKTRQAAHRILLILAPILALNVCACRPKKEPCFLPEEDKELISALARASVGDSKRKAASASSPSPDEEKLRHKQRFLRKIMERLAGNSKRRAQEVCNALHSPPRGEDDFYKARILTLLDREQQMLEAESVLSKLRRVFTGAEDANRRVKDELGIPCAKLWSEATAAHAPPDPRLLEVCDANLDKLQSSLLEGFNELLASVDQGHGAGGLLRETEQVLTKAEGALARVKSLTIGDIAERCEKAHSGCAAAFSLARFFELTDDKKVRFDYERAVIYGMILGARRAEQSFESLLVSAGWFASPVDILSRPIFHILIAKVETFVVEEIEEALMARKTRIITKGGLLQSACNAYAEFDAAAPPSAAERTVRNVILSFHEQTVPKHIPSANVCNPEAALMDEIPQVDAKVRRNLRRAGTRKLARNIRREYRAEAAAGNVRGKDWYRFALESEPVELAPELRRSRNADGTLTAAASGRIEDISQCIIDESLECGRSGRLDDYSSCIAGRCGTHHYVYFVEPETFGPPPNDDACCESCCDEEGSTTARVVERSLRADIERLEGVILEERLRVIEVLSKKPGGILEVEGELSDTICNPGAEPKARVTFTGGTSELKAKDICDFGNPMPLFWDAATHLESCHRRDPATERNGKQPTPQAALERLKLAPTIGPMLDSARVEHKMVFTGFSSALNAYRCHPKRNQGLDWDENVVKAFNESYSPPKRLQLPTWMEGREEGCPGEEINRILRYLRAQVFCNVILKNTGFASTWRATKDASEADRCKDNPKVEIRESADHEHPVLELCSKVGATPSSSLASCKEKQMDQCFADTKTKSEHVAHLAAEDRKVTVSFVPVAELKSIDERKLLLARLASIQATRGACK